MSRPDYYAVLGILPSAEDIVIRAAYRALAQRYHPDKWQGDANEATQRMAEINEAYAILSDPKKRSDFDRTRGAQEEAESVFDEPSGKSNFDDPLTTNWSIATEYYPALIAIERELNEVSSALAYAYRALMLDTKEFDRMRELAARMRKQFLARYFGDSPEIQEFAVFLIKQKNKAAALELNTAIKVLGENADPGMIIRKLKQKYSVQTEVEDEAESSDTWRSEKSQPNHVVGSKRIDIRAGLGI